MRNRVYWIACFGLFAATLAQSASIYDEQHKLSRANEQVKALKGDIFGEKINLSNGTLEFAHTDVSLPGNNPLPVAISRRLRAAEERSGGLGAFADWDIEIPHLEGIYARGAGWSVPGGGGRCNAFGRPPVMPGTRDSYWNPSEYWHGHFLSLPGSGKQEMLKAHATSLKPSDSAFYPAVTKSQWAFKCTTASDGGEGFIGISPEGTTYVFDRVISRPTSLATKPDPNPVPFRGQDGKSVPTPDALPGAQLNRDEIWIMPSVVTDRHGNTVTYGYDAGNPWKVTSISSSDGRNIALSYGSYDLVSSVSDNSRTWTYTYDSTIGNHIVLSSVTLPDNTTWQYNLRGLTVAPPIVGEGASCDDTPMGGDTLVGSITHPSGVQGQFTMQPVLHGRSYVERQCWGSNNETYAIYPRHMPTYSIASKVISGAGIPNRTWTYSYGPANASWLSECGAGCPDTKTVTVAAPDTTTVYTFGNRFNGNDGQLLQVNVGGVRVTNNRYMGYGAAGICYPVTAGDSPQTRVYGSTATWNLPQYEREINQDGAWFKWTVTSPANFDCKARPTAQTKASSLNFSRVDTASYVDIDIRWILGQIGQTTTDGYETLLNTYDLTNGDLLNVKRNGIVAESRGYNTDGTLYSRTDGNGHTTTFHQYMRGTPQSVQYPDLTQESATVHNIGVITAYTNGAGATTLYNFDPTTFLLTSIENAGGDPLASNPTLITWGRVYNDDYGLGQGHWRQTLSTGNARTITDYDALWQPRVTQTFDNASPGTSTFVMRNFDSEGRQILESYKSSSPNAAGVATQYDAIGRAVRQFADTEVGLATTQINYLGGFQRQVVDPLNNPTVTSFQAFDEPSEEAPMSISAPQDTNTAFARNNLGLTTQLTRWGNAGYAVSATRSYVYDAHYRVCKTVEPELGATIQEYDNQGNVTWKASGQGLTGIGQCDREGVPQAERTSFGYDNVNQLTSTVFGDGSPGISRTHTGDGKLLTTSSEGLTWSYDYYKLGGLRSESLNGNGLSFQFQYARDANGSVQSITYPNGAVVSQDPNALGQARNIVDQSVSRPLATNITYHPNGTVAGFTYGNGVAHAKSQVARGLPYQIYHPNVANRTYAYDLNGNMVGTTDYVDNTTSSTMAYDGLDRLIVANSGNLWGSGSYSYDALDNLRTSNIGARTAVHNYDGANRLASYEIPGTNCGFTYDVRGNTTSRCGQNYVFDQGNRMRQTYGAIGNATYTYDGHGRRTSINEGGVANLQVYTQSGKLMYGLKTSGSEGHTSYIYVGKDLIAERDVSGIPTFVHSDPLGTPIAKTNLAGSVITSRQHEPYGPTWNSGCNALSGPGFTGHVNDTASCMVYMQQRYYDPWAGRFLSVDPVTPEAGGGFNRYNYANNNPYRFTDPSGESPDDGNDGSMTKARRASINHSLGNGTTGTPSGTTARAIPASSAANSAYATPSGSLDDLLSTIFSDGDCGAKYSCGTLPVGGIGKALEAAKAAGIVAKDGTAINGLTKHGVDRVIGDGAKRAGTRPEAILDAVKKPTKIKESVDNLGRPFKVYTGQDARVVINPETGKIISTNPLSGQGAHIP